MSAINLHIATTMPMRFHKIILTRLRLQLLEDKNPMSTLASIGISSTTMEGQVEVLHMIELLVLGGGMYDASDVCCDCV